VLPILAYAVSIKSDYHNAMIDTDHLSLTVSKLKQIKQKPTTTGAPV
jgi:hypothetical protein